LDVTIAVILIEEEKKEGRIFCGSEVLGRCSFV
jgi:hypothetical protein